MTPALVGDSIEAGDADGVMLRRELIAFAADPPWKEAKSADIDETIRLQRFLWGY